VGRIRKTHSNPLDYDAAVSWFGEEAIRAQASRPQTLSMWKTRGVPADVVLPMVLERFGPRDLPVGAARDHAPGYQRDAADLVAEELRRHPEAIEWVRLLLRILRDGGPGRSVGIQENLKAFAGDMQRETAASGGGKRARDAGESGGEGAQAGGRPARKMATA